MPDTIITGGGGDSGAGLGLILGIIIVILFLVAGGFVWFGHSGSGSTVHVDVPKVTVNNG